jgi:hypothetical protein
MKPTLFAHWGIRESNVSQRVAASSTASCGRSAEAASDPSMTAPSIVEYYGAESARASEPDESTRYAGCASDP